ncbi:MAG: hypothetical protein BMS9Abin39_0849 [Ignavibacteria bacterium]|nr:MAG: hypothetical protein BMS9Abin39_0849 [Ignavibacteria bacterium]
MPENINIDERDIFNFVFFNDLLSEEKIRYIENNEDKIEGINFYRNLKKSLTEPLSKEIKEKIAAKIPAYKIPSVIKLFPVNDKIKKKPSEVPILAAASAEQQPAVSAQSFIDEDKIFVARILRIDKLAKIYLFPVKIIPVAEIILTILPSYNKYLFSNYNTPVEVVDLPQVEVIELEIN